MPLKDKKNVTLDYEFNDKLPMSVSFDIDLKMGEQTHRYGLIAVEKSTSSGKRTKTSGGMTINELDAKIDRVDVILTPNPKHIEKWSTVHEIWGQPITIKDVPLTRLDVPSAQAERTEPTP